MNHRPTNLCIGSESQSGRPPYLIGHLTNFRIYRASAETLLIACFIGPDGRGGGDPGVAAIPSAAAFGIIALPPNPKHWTFGEAVLEFRKTRRGYEANERNDRYRGLHLSG